jgi:hypothetical protein
MHNRIISAVKGVEIVSDTLLYIILSRHWCDIIFLNVEASTEVQIVCLKESFWEEF